ncbi:hypothetical protein ACJX0J_015881 [Zea mays]
MLTWLVTFLGLICSCVKVQRSTSLMTTHVKKTEMTNICYALPIGHGVFQVMERDCIWKQHLALQGHEKQPHEDGVQQEAKELAKAATAATNLDNVGATNDEHTNKE